MLALAIIDKKRDFGVLSRAEIQFMLSGFLDGSIPDYQMAAWAMAVLCRGMNQQETADLTDCMLASGQRLPRVTERPRIDKHSTGGLGDKVSLVLAPLLACFEVEVPMLSGRGLGLTGGTLDKLESYPGYRSDLSQAEIGRQLERIGCVISGTTHEIAPADRKLYALRDATGTVPCLSLITASIMSKKLAATLDALVLDVKFGSGAFMKDAQQAGRLADSLLTTGQRMQLRTMAVLSDMNQPLGRMVGNACEANEAVEILSSQIDSQALHPQSARVRSLCLRLGAELLVAIGQAADLEQASACLTAALDDGRALRKYQQMIEAQSGAFSLQLPLARAHVLTAKSNAWVAAMDGQCIGRAALALGAGRHRQGAAIQHSVGLEMLTNLGAAVTSGQPLMRIFCDDPLRLEQALHFLGQAIHFSEQPTAAPALILDRNPSQA